MKIVKYDKKYRQDFINLNLEWIEKFYKVESCDMEMLENIIDYD